MKKLPIGIQTFEKIIRGGYLYVDKTKQIHDIVTGGTTYFLSRPRRFGKSLLCSTLEEIFKGNKELFKGLWIYNSDYDWQPYPVIRISMPKTIQNSPEQFEKWLNERINKIANQNNIDIDITETLQTRFSTIIEKLSKKNKVAIIIDEYDKPILDNITNIEVAEKMREILSSFYTTFKDLDEYLSFIFITGVSRFSKTTIFSGLNNLKDITLSRKYATLLGYTQEELECNFKDRIKELSVEQQISGKQALLELKSWYNGYKFAKRTETVYNPFSILLVLDEYDFQNYWFESGTPTFLVNVIREKNFDYADPKSFEITELQIGNFDIKNINPKTLLFQTGYLTINRHDPALRRFYLKYPNSEVEESLLEVLLESFSGIDPVISDDTILELTETLENNDLKKFKEVVYTFFASIPYTIQIEHPTTLKLRRVSPLKPCAKEDEKYYQTIFYTLLRLLNIKIDVELSTNIGRIDAVVIIKNFVYIFEFKINQSAQKALQQIEDKKYYEQFSGKKNKIFTVGINFDTKEKNISGFEVKEIES